MFNRGVDELLQSLPQLGNLDADDVRRILTRAWLEAVDRRDFGGPGVESASLIHDLRRLATALEMHAILVADIDPQTIRASAFVAAEALEVASEVGSLAPEASRPWLFGTHRRFERVEAGLLYRIAGYDANAALVGRQIESLESEDETDEFAISEWVLDGIRSLLLLQLRPDTSAPPPPTTDRPLRMRVRHAIWMLLGNAVRSHLRWLTMVTDDIDSGIESIRRLIEALEGQVDRRDNGVPHADLHHLALLLVSSMDGSADRALRMLPPPPDDDGRFKLFQRQRASIHPLLWPAAATYAEIALPGPNSHAVVSVPTGAGKSAVAELAIAQAIRDGWILYLSPTNALAGQIRRHLNDVIGQLPGVTVREFAGGAEYIELEGEIFDTVEESQILVMTPEKCSLALRQAPDTFERMALCVVDEAHTLGEPGGRAVIAELVLSEVLHRAPKARVLLLSALLSNPEELAGWLHSATGIEAHVIDTPWRPTRTLRAIAGFDQKRANEAAKKARVLAQALPSNRKNVPFGAPLALFAGLQGAWRTSELIDFAFAPTTIEVPVIYHKDNGVDLDGYLNATVRALVQALGDRNQRVLAFLPKSKHYSFLAARKIDGFSDQGPVDIGEDISAQLALADAELGGPSELRSALMKRVGVHTSAMLQEERRASEIAFDRGLAWAMFATGTMAQGLNLPATAVVIGGTTIGWDKDSNSQQDRQRERAQLLNAIGRVGRANVAPRSIAIVVPNKPVAFNTGTDAKSTIRMADFLREEDASTEISSQLDALIMRALDGTLNITDMTTEEQTAFAFLSFSTEGNDTEGVLRRSWAIHRAGTIERAAEVGRLLGQLGSEFLHGISAPEWVALAAHRSGMALPETARLYAVLQEYLRNNPAPTSIGQWADALLQVLREMPLERLEHALRSDPFDSTKIAAIWSMDDADRANGWEALQATLNSWLRGQDILQVAEASEKKNPNGRTGRSQQDPLPRTLKVVNDGFGFGLAIVAGTLSAIVAAGRDNDPDGPWGLPENSARALALLPLAIRFGAGTPSIIAWMRAGARPRVLAHLLDRLIGTPSGLDDEALRIWANRQLNLIADDRVQPATNSEEQALISAMIVSRRNL